MTEQSILDDLLERSIEALDISALEYVAAVRRYEELSEFLCAYWSDSPVDGAIYPQGSMNLGTVTRIFHRNDEYDLDAVCQREYTRGSISQDDLKTDVGDGLELFSKCGPTDAPLLDDEGRRCWTLLYPGQHFHLDVLPGLPDIEAQPNGILLTDTTRTRWLQSNPWDYGQWFRGVMAEELADRMVVLSKRMDVTDVPTETVKTTLQRSVQALKRHRDIYFAEHLDRRPPSILITTLAARAYRGGGPLFEVLRDITARMPELITIESGTPIVSNPVQPKENFAERWAGDVARLEEFYAWMASAYRSFTNLGADAGIDQVITKMAAALGERPAKYAATRAGLSTSRIQRAGGLGTAIGTGNLVAGVERISKPHTFRGDTKG